MAWLPAVMQNIAERIVADDWFERESADGSQSYYVIGQSAYWDDVNGGYHYIDCLVTPGPETGPLAEYLVRSQVARGHPDYLKRSRKRLEQAGAPPAAIDRLVAGDREAAGELLEFAMENIRRCGESDEKWMAFSHFLEALAITRCREQGRLVKTELDQEEVQEVDLAREKQCLKELVSQYGKIVNRWEQLDPLPFDDPQLEEATRCFLYGFYRAAVVLSASALEGRLKRITGIVRADSYRELLEAAQHKAGFGEEIEGHVREVFSKRNDVVHESWKPDRDSASGVLVQARMALLALPPD